jgi:alanine racemase
MDRPSPSAEPSDPGASRRGRGEGAAAGPRTAVTSGTTSLDPRRYARPNVFEIDLDAVASNVREIRRFVGPDVRVLGALKANGYGFGLLEVADVVAATGIDMVCVADLSDAIRIREHGLTIPILLYAGNLVEAATVEAAVDHDLTVTVTDLDGARACSRLARRPLAVLAKIDVGLERLGIPVEQAPSTVREVAALPGLRLAGMYAHLHVTGSDGHPDYVRWQLGRFNGAIADVRELGVEVPFAAAASTPVLPRYGPGGLNGVDVGRLLYGSLRSDRDVTAQMVIRNAFLALRSRLIHCRPVTRTEHLAEAPFPIRPGMRLGIAPIGYADGIDSLNAGYALVRGQPAPIIGGPSLEHTRLDLTDIPSATVGDEVTFVGRQLGVEITPDDVMRHLGIEQPARMATSVRDSIPRIYHGRAR